MDKERFLTCDKSAIDEILISANKGKKDMEKKLFIAVGWYGYERKVAGPYTKAAIEHLLNDPVQVCRWEVFSLTPVPINEVPVVVTTFKKEI